MNSPIVNLTLAVLALLSIMTWAIAILKIRAGRKVSAQNKSFLESFWNASDWSAGREAAQAGAGTVASLAQAGFSVFDDYVHGPRALKHDGDVDKVLERPMRQAIQGIQRQQERGMAELASVGSTAPFVGLFGTVWGIMGALHTISGTGQATIDIVAGPIGDALIATAVGIATALPGVLFYNYFVRRTQVAQTELDGFMDDFLRLAARQMQDTQS